METEPPVRYVVTEEQLENLIFFHQEVVRCAFQKYSTANAQMKAENALDECKRNVFIESQPAFHQSWHQ